MIALTDLVSHGKNSNRMNAEYYKSLKRHIKKTGMYPAIIVREGG